MNQELVVRLRKGKDLVKKYEMLFKARDIFKKLNEHIVRNTILVVVLLGISYVRIALPITFIFPVVGGILWYQLSKLAGNLAAKIEKKDEENGYSSSIRDLIPEVPESYWKSKLLKKLVKIVEKGRADSVQEAFSVYEEDEKVKKRNKIIAVIVAIIGVNKIGDYLAGKVEENINAGFSSLRNGNSREADKIARKIKEEKKRANYTANKKQERADYLKREAKNHAGKSDAMDWVQHANAAQREANAAKRYRL